MNTITIAAPLFVFGFLVWFVVWMDCRFERQAREIAEARAQSEHRKTVLAIAVQEAFNEGADAAFRRAQLQDWEFTNLELWRESQAKKNVEGV